MVNSYRELCEKLVDAIDAGIPPERIINSPLLEYAHALLNQPEPVAPTDEELWEAYDQMDGVPEDWPWCRDYARAVLAKWGNQ